MKISALVTSLVLGLSSTVALAAPSGAQYHQPYRGPDVRDHRLPAPAVEMAPRLRWTALAASDVRFGRQVINVSSRARYSQLKIEATRGMTSIDKVLVTFANGRTETIEVDKRIGMGARDAAMIDLQGRDRQITKIVIVTKGLRNRSSFSVLAA